MKRDATWQSRLGLLALLGFAAAGAFFAPGSSAYARPVSARRLPALQWSMDCRWLSTLPDAAR